MAVTAMQQTQQGGSDMNNEHDNGQSDNIGSDRISDGMPIPKVRLPENFVPRSDALNVVKEKLLAEDDRTLVVSAISGLGGLGKSVLAAAVVLDAEVQARFPDGILWVTLGQNPDLQTMLGDWIRELDKSREAFSANTLESASRYLHNLLAERRMLLVVDDVWNAAHTQWFRVGGAGCRVLVTTREAQIEGADYYPLDLMSPDEAVALVRQKLKSQWRPEQEAEVKAVAKLLGYLPLALDLAANQVRDGLTWVELRSAFEVERRTVALEGLDQSEAWEHLDEEQQRKYSLRASFNLSLRRLEAEQLQQFSWLGVLPEDVNLEATAPAVLWDLPLLQAEKILLDLRQRSLLTDGVTTLDGISTYHIHDLIHDMARSLIEAGILDLPNQNSKSEIQNLPLAHRQFLERYRECATDHRWDRLPNDSYIHRHLSWHLEQANWADELHGLLAISDEQGHNAWFEACNRIGQPAIFVEDVVRAWRLAEQTYEQAPTESIVLQCRYALVTATLNSLISNLPIDLMIEFIEHQFWTVEQVWAYVEQMQEEGNVAKAIYALAPYLSKSLFQVAVDKARKIQDEKIEDWCNRDRVLKKLAQTDGADFEMRLKAARSIRYASSRAESLRSLVQIDRTYFPEALEAARLIQNERSRAESLHSLAQIDRTYWPEALKAAQAIRNKFDRAWALSNLALIDQTYFSEALKAAQAIRDKFDRAWVLSNLAQVNRTYFPEALKVAQAIRSEYIRAKILYKLAQADEADFATRLEAARSTHNEFIWAEVLCSLAQIDGTYFPKALAATRSIRDEYGRAEVLRDLAQIDGTYFSEALAAAQAIQHEVKRAEALCSLALIDQTYFSEALKAAQAIHYESDRARVLSRLVQVNDADFIALLETARSIRDEYSRSQILCGLAKIDGAYFSEALEIARSISHKHSRLNILRNLAQIDGIYFSEVLEATRSIHDESDRAMALSSLAQLDRTYFSEALEAARLIQDRSDRAEALYSLTKIKGTYLPEALEVAQSIQNEDSRRRILCSLAEQAPEVLSNSLSNFSLDSLSYSDWQTYLHILAHHKRSELMLDLVTLYPAIVHLGGETAMRSVVDVMWEICEQWK